MPKATAVLFGIEDEFDVLSVDRLEPGQIKIIIESVSREGPCPACGVVSGRVKDRPLRRISDLPASGQKTQLWWRKRRLVCAEALCERMTFTQTSAAIGPRARVTQRLRQQLATAIAAGNRAVSEVAREYGVSWPTAHRALVALGPVGGAGERGEHVFELHGAGQPDHAVAGVGADRLHPGDVAKAGGHFTYAATAAHAADEQVELTHDGLTLEIPSALTPLRVRCRAVRPLSTWLHLKLGHDQPPVGRDGRREPP